MSVSIAHYSIHLNVQCAEDLVFQINRYTKKVTVIKTKKGHGRHSGAYCVFLLLQPHAIPRVWTVSVRVPTCASAGASMVVLLVMRTLQVGRTVCLSVCTPVRLPVRLASGSLPACFSASLSACPILRNSTSFSVDFGSFVGNEEVLLRWPWLSREETHRQRDVRNGVLWRRGRNLGKLSPRHLRALWGL